MSEVFVVEIEVLDVWIEDGLDLTTASGKMKLEEAIDERFTGGNAFAGEIKVISAKKKRKPRKNKTKDGA